jgi:protein-arginine deiminase
MHHLQVAEEIYATEVSLSQGSALFRADLISAAEVAGVPQGFKPLKPLLSQDQWTQDWMELAWMTMPNAGGEHRIVAYVRSANVFAPNKPDSPLRSAGRHVYEGFHGQDVAGVTPDFDIQHDGSMDSLNSYGNLETIPPYEHNGQKYTMGRVFRGNVPDFYPDPEFVRMCEAQEVQPPVYVDTAWLLVGHVDETISFIKMSNPRGWGMAVNDAALAKKMLEDLVGQGHAGVIMFAGKKIYNDNNQEVLAEATIQQVLDDTEVMGESAKAVIEVDAQLTILRNETGITDAEIIRVPFLHEPAYGYSLAYQPGTVNGIYLSDTVFGAPTPHGPVINGVDPFQKQLQDEFGKHGITVQFIEDWDLYHRLSGEVHCGSNTKRALPTNGRWWESGR